MSLHIRFLSDELKAQREQFEKKCNTSALLLKQRKEVFVCQYVGLKNGQVVVKVRNDQGLPRKDEYFLGIVLYEQSRYLNNYKNWGEITWGELGEYQSYFTEAKVIWKSSTEQEDLSLLGLGRVNMSFVQVLTPGCIIILGPQKPPLDYLRNLFQLTHYHEEINAQLLNASEFILDKDQVIPLDNSKEIVNDIADSIEEEGRIVVLGPPGTGKTFLISQLCAGYLSKNNKVLVTALTNRALIEVAGKEPLAGFLKEKKIYKTNLSEEEKHELPDLQLLGEIYPDPGALMLASFHALSSYINSPNPYQFDYLIVDEASQALLAMLKAVLKIGSRIIFVGDTNQLSAVCVLNEDVIKEEGYRPYVESLASLLKESGYKTFLLSKTRRLSQRAARYTSLFYGGMLESTSKQTNNSEYKIPDKIGNFLHPEGGPVWLRLPLEPHQKSPESGIKFIASLVLKLSSHNQKLDIAVLSYYRDTISALQAYLHMHECNHKHLMVDTVSRVQGKTCDICIYFIPDHYYYHACSSSVFNVATSRARMHTIIISSEKLLEYDNLDERVKKYLSALKNDFSFEIQSLPALEKAPNRLPNA